MPPDPDPDDEDDVPNPPPRGLPEPDPNLRNITHGVPDDDAIDAPLPEVRTTSEGGVGEERGGREGVTHVVMRVSVKRQTEIFRSVGYNYDWNFPFPFWHFLGKVAARAVFGDEEGGGAVVPVLEVLNFVVLGKREFVALTTPLWREAVGARKGEGGVRGEGKMPPLKVLEVEFKKMEDGEPLEVVWGPARAMVTEHIRRWIHESDREEMDEEGSGPDEDENNAGGQ